MLHEEAALLGVDAGIMALMLDTDRLVDFHPSNPAPFAAINYALGHEGRGLAATLAKGQYGIKLTHVDDTLFGGKGDRRVAKMSIGLELADADASFTLNESTLVCLGDPCYWLIDQNARGLDGSDYEKLIDTMTGDLFEEPDLKVFVSSTGYGDGLYPVDVEVNDAGEVVGLYVTFIDEDEELEKGV